MKLKYSRFLYLLLFLFDLVVLNVSLICSHLILNNIITDSKITIMFLCIVNATWVFNSIQSQSLKPSLVAKLSENVKCFAKALAYHLITIGALIYFFKIDKVSRTELSIGYTAFFAVASLMRFLLYTRVVYKRNKAADTDRIMVIGDEDIAIRFIDTYNETHVGEYQLVDFISQTQLANLPFWDLSTKISNLKPHQIYFCVVKADDHLLKQITAIAENLNVQLKVVTDVVLSNIHSVAIERYGNLPVMNITSKTYLSFEKVFAKRGFDILFSLLVMIAGAPIFALIYVITKLTSEGPAFYLQERIGLGGKPFKIVKFRSMIVNSETAGPQLTTDNDPRITKWGYFMRKTRLDELPQFWNVLKGDMSVVGPRPERRYFIDQIIQKDPMYATLLKLKPGITSLGQVHYGYAATVDEMCERLPYDLHYLTKIDFNSDISIIYKTVRVMVQGKGK
jgi:exopolysaccharide biosynthesis polyprenyl glycosylphosphotransferase